MVTSPQTFARKVLEKLKEVSSTLAGNKIRLFKQPILPGPRTALADFIPCDFDGYADSDAVVWGSVMHTGSDAVQMTGDVKEFLAASDETTNTVHGWVLVNLAGDDWVMAEVFPDPVPIVEAGQGLALLPVVVLPSDVFV